MATYTDYTEELGAALDAALGSNGWEPLSTDGSWIDDAGRERLRIEIAGARRRVALLDCTGELHVLEEHDPESDV